MKPSFSLFVLECSMHVFTGGAPLLNVTLANVTCTMNGSLGLWRAVWPALLLGWSCGQRSVLWSHRCLQHVCACGPRARNAGWHDVSESLSARADWCEGAQLLCAIVQPRSLKSSGPEFHVQMWKTGLRIVSELAQLLLQRSEIACIMLGGGHLPLQILQHPLSLLTFLGPVQQHLLLRVTSSLCVGCVVWVLTTIPHRVTKTGFPAVSMICNLKDSCIQHSLILFSL